MSDTAQIILAVIGTGVTLLGVLVGLLVFLFRIQRQDLAALRQDLASLRQELRTDIAALHARIDALYLSLFSHRNPAA